MVRYSRRCSSFQHRQIKDIPYCLNSATLISYSWRYMELEKEKNGRAAQYLTEDVMAFMMEGWKGEICSVRAVHLLFRPKWKRKKLSADGACHRNYYCLLSTKGSLSTWLWEFALVLKGKWAIKDIYTNVLWLTNMLAEMSPSICLASCDGVIITSMLFLVMIFQQLKLHFEDSFLISGSCSVT